MVIDVDSYERAVEPVGELSAASGAGGQPIHAWIELRPFLTTLPTSEELPNEGGFASEPHVRRARELVRRGADFAVAEDAVQDALVEAVRVCLADLRGKRRAGWSVTWRTFLDATGAEIVRRRRTGSTPVTAISVFVGLGRAVRAWHRR